MNKNDLIEKVVSLAKLPRIDASRAVDSVFEAISSSLKNNEEVRLIGFGTFSIVNRPETEGRNPRTGEKIKIPATRRPKFTPGKNLKEAVEM